MVVRKKGERDKETKRGMSNTRMGWKYKVKRREERTGNEKRKLLRVQRNGGNEREKEEKRGEWRGKKEEKRRRRKKKQEEEKKRRGNSEEEVMNVGEEETGKIKEIKLIREPLEKISGKQREGKNHM